LYRQALFEKKEQKKRDQIKAGLVSDVFPTVSGIVIKMKYVHNAAVPIVMNRTLNVFPSSYAYFHMDCLVRGCENGGFDLTSVIHRLIKKGGLSCKGELKCCGGSDNVAADHASISYEVTVTYAKKARLKQSP